MKHLSLLLPLLPLSICSYLPPAQHIFSNPSSSPSSSSPDISRIPTTYESAILARRILHLEAIGTLSTIFPPSSSNSSSHDGQDEYRHHPPAEELAGVPIGLMDYVGDCEPRGNPTLLAVKIATSFRNEAAGSNISLNMRWHPAYSYAHQYSAASMPRFSLMGYLEKMTAAEVQDAGIEGCFMGYHPDAVVWYPGNGIHESEWVRLVVQKVYWIGGFGDRAYIGWIPVEEWRSVTREEMESARLPGERRRKGWFLDWWGGRW